MKPTTILTVLGGLTAAAILSAVFDRSKSVTPAPTPTPKPTTTTKPVATNVPLTIVDRVLTQGSTDAMRSNAVWLNDNGYPQTGAALDQFASGDIDAATLRSIATAEFTKAKPKGTGTTAIDEYGMGLVSQGTDDEVYSYALTSNSIPLVKASAERLALRGDVRALELTSRLAAIT